MDEDWKEKKLFDYSERGRLERERRIARKADRVEDQAATRDLAELRGRLQLDLVEQRKEVSQFEKEMEVQGEAMLQLVRHRLQPEELQRLQEDLAIRKTIEVQAYERELRAETLSKSTLLAVEGDEERQAIKATLKARLTEMLAEHKLRLLDREHAHGIAKDLATHEASLGGAGGVLDPEDANQIDHYIREQVQGQMDSSGVDSEEDSE